MGKRWRRARRQMAPHRVVWRLLFGHNPPTVRAVRRSAVRRLAAPLREREVARISKGSNGQLRNRGAVRTSDGWRVQPVARVGRTKGVMSAAERRRAEEQRNIDRVIASSVRRDQAAAATAQPVSMKQRVRRTRDGKFNGSTTAGQPKTPTMRDVAATMRSANAALRAAERRAARDLGWDEPS